MSESNFTTKKIGIIAIFISVGIILQYLESRIIISPVPGGKLGLGNIVSIINIFIFGYSNALLVSFLRAFLGTILTSGFSALPYSLSGALASTIAMCIMKKYFYPEVSIVGISVIGAVLHNISQLFVASLIFSSGYIFSYLPVLLTVGVFSGIATGYGTQIFANRIMKKGEIK